MEDKCVVLGCSANKWKAQKKRITMFKVPENLERLEKWKESLPALKETLTPECFVCEEHFNDTDFIKYSFEIESDGQWIPVIGLRLQTGAIPLCIANREDDFLSLYEAFQNEKLDNESMKRSLLLKAIDLKREDVVEEMISLGTSLDAPGPDGRTALQIAIAKNNRDIMELLVQNGADFHFETKFGKPFAYAVSLGHTAILDFFMKKGVDVNEKNQYGNTALHTMCNNEELIDSKETWSFLLKHGAHADAENLEKKTPLYYLSCKLTHLISGSCSWGKLNSALNLMSEFLNQGVELDDTLIKHPLILPCAVKSECELLTEYLCKRNVDVNEVVPSLGCTRSHHDHVLMIAIESQNLNILKILMDHGARSQPHHELLHFCVRIGFVDGLQFLLEKGMDANMKGLENRTPLHKLFSARMNCKDELLSRKKSKMCRLLLNHGASLEQVDRSGRTPLQLAREEDLIEMIDSLTDNRPNISCDMKYRKLFEFAASEALVTLMNTLLERGVDINGKNAQGETTLHIICKNCNEYSSEVCTFLLSRGANVHVVDNQNETPIFCASQYVYKLFLSLPEPANDQPWDLDPWSQSEDGFNLLVLRLFLMHKLITQEADVNVVLQGCPILFHIAVIVGIEKLVQCLLERNVDVNSRIDEGATALHCAAYFNRCIIVPILLRHGADINAIMDKKLNPLHLAVSRGYTRVTLMLLNLGADINAQDAWGQTVFHLAAIGQQSARFLSFFLRAAHTNIKDIYGLTVHDIVSDPLDYSTKHPELSRNINAERKRILHGVREKCPEVEICQSRFSTSAKNHLLSTYFTLPSGVEFNAANRSSRIFRRCLCFMESRTKIRNMSEEQLMSLINANTNPMDTELAQQVRLMRRTEVLDGVTLYDIATKHFREMARCLEVTKMPDLDGFTRLGYYFLLHKQILAIERHWAGNELRKRLKVTLPEEIIDEIMKILNARDIRNVLNATVGYEVMAFNDVAYEYKVAEDEAYLTSSESDDNDDQEIFYDHHLCNHEYPYE